MGGKHSRERERGEAPAALIAPGSDAGSDAGAIPYIPWKRRLAKYLDSLGTLIDRETLPVQLQGHSHVLPSKETVKAYFIIPELRAQISLMVQQIIYAILEEYEIPDNVEVQIRDRKLTFFHRWTGSELEGARAFATDMARDLLQDRADVWNDLDLLKGKLTWEEENIVSHHGPEITRLLKSHQSKRNGPVRRPDLVGPALEEVEEAQQAAIANMGTILEEVPERDRIDVLSAMGVEILGGAEYFKLATDPEFQRMIAYTMALDIGDVEEDEVDRSGPVAASSAADVGPVVPSDTRRQALEQELASIKARMAREKASRGMGAGSEGLPGRRDRIMRDLEEMSGTAGGRGDDSGAADPRQPAVERKPVARTEGRGRRETLIAQFPKWYRENVVDGITMPWASRPPSVSNEALFYENAPETTKEMYDRWSKGDTFEASFGSYLENLPKGDLTSTEKRELVLELSYLSRLQLDYLAGEAVLTPGQRRKLAELLNVLPLRQREFITSLRPNDAEIQNLLSEEMLRGRYGRLSTKTQAIVAAILRSAAGAHGSRVSRDAIKIRLQYLEKVKKLLERELELIDVPEPVQDWSTMSDFTPGLVPPASPDPSKPREKSFAPYLRKVIGEIVDPPLLELAAAASAVRKRLGGSGERPRGGQRKGSRRRPRRSSGRKTTLLKKIHKNKNSFSTRAKNVSKDKRTARRLRPFI